MYEDRNGTDIYYYYDSNGTPTAIRYYEADGTSYMFYLATNQQGDIIGIYNASGNMVVKYEYDAWGNIISTTDANGGALNSLSQKWSDINPFRYRGYYYDSETGLYYLQSRYYDAEVGRFINSDVLLDNRSLSSINPFAYCGNNPVNFIDHNGMCFDWLWDFFDDVANFFSDLFGYSSAAVLSETVVDIPITPFEYPFSVHNGTRIEQEIVMNDSDGFIDFYNDIESGGAYGGIRMNGDRGVVDIGYDMLGNGIRLTLNHFNDDGIIKSVEISLNYKNISVEFADMTCHNNIYHVSYTDINIDMMFILGVVLFPTKSFGVQPTFNKSLAPAF